jgi:polar amino acid transport system substrate-binding protein
MKICNLNGLTLLIISTILVLVNTFLIKKEQAVSLLNNQLSSLILACLFSTTAWCDEINYLVVEDISKPFQITENNESKGGIVSDIIDEIFKDSEHTITSHVLPLKRLYKLVKSGEIKNWIAYDAKVWNALSQWGNFVEEPLFSVNHTYLTCQQNAPIKITSSKDIETRNLAIIKNFDYPELTQLQQTGKLNLTSVEGYQQGIKLAGLNRIDGFVEMELRLRFNIQQEQLNKPCFRFINMSQVIPEYSIYLTIDKNNNTLNNFAEQRIKELKEAGTINSILDRYTQTKLLSSSDN